VFPLLVPLTQAPFEKVIELKVPSTEVPSVSWVFVSWAFDRRRVLTSPVPKVTDG